MQSHPDISIIIVNYNSGTLLSGCVNSIFQNIIYNIEVIVVDNNSDDDSIDLVSRNHREDNRLIIIRSEVNRGFGIANNKGASEAKGKYFHFLNPDVIVDGSLNRVYERILKNNIHGAIVTSLVNSSSEPQKMQHLMPTLGNYIKRIFNPSACTYWNIGASIIIDRQSFNKIGGWAEDYFMYAEDLDFFYQLNSKNIPIAYVDEAVIHIGRGTSSKRWSSLERAVRVEKSFQRFYKKYGLFYQYPLVRAMQLIFMLFREPDQFILSIRAIIRTI